MYIFALAIGAVVQNVPLGAQNRIKATLVLTGPVPTGTSIPGCPDKNSLIYGMPGDENCAMKITGSGDAKKAVCKDGPKKDCECIGALGGHIYRTSPGHQKVMNAVRQVFGKSTGAQCPIAVTDIPRDVFSSSKMNIHSHFCEGWLKDTRKTMTVNSTGGNVLPEPHKKAVTKRTPPADPASYSSFRFDLSYEPNGKGEGACKQDCNAAFSQLANSCAFSSPGIYMYEKGAYDVDCGKFEYKISKSNEPPIQEVADFIEYNRYCYKPEEPPPAQRGCQQPSNYDEHTMAL